MYALIENGVVTRYPYTVTDLKLANRGTSFPKQISDETLLEFGLHKVFEVLPPSTTDAQVLEEGTPVFTSDRWTQVWAVRDMTAEEVESRNSSHAEQVRFERNAKLAESDWTQVADAPVDKAAWATYRQALRDITAQVGFPLTITWPVQP